MSSLSFSIEPIYGSPWWAIIAAAAVLGVLIGVTPPTDDVRRRRVLMGLRAMAGALLVLVMFRPTLVRTDDQPASATLIVAVDASRSMTLPDGNQNVRWKTQAAAASRLHELLDSIDDDRLSVKWMAYGERTRMIPDGPATLLQTAPIDDQTGLTAAIEDGLLATDGQPPAGIVLMGDGTEVVSDGARSRDSSTAQGRTSQNRGDIRQVVSSLDALGVALWTVPIGPATTNRRRDVMIESLPESLSLFSGNRFDVRFTTSATGLAGAEWNVNLNWIDSQGKSIPAATRSVAATSAEETIAMQVPVTVPPPGAYQLVVEAETVTGETRVTNNRQVSFVDIREGGGRILYLEGSPRLEQTFLRRSIRRFPDLDLTYRWIPADTRTSWPVDLGDVFEPGQYDVFILGDLPAAALGEPALQALAQRVRDGAGLITLGGRSTYAAGGYRASFLEPLLPLRLPNRSGNLDGPLEIQLARTHPITDLGGDAPDAIWETLPPLAGADQLGELRSIPGAAVLLQTRNEEPLLAIAPAGRGRVAMLAMDSTWRWWRGGADEAHRRFWRQLLLWVLARENDDDAMVRLTLDRRRIEMGQSTDFRAELQSREGPSATDRVSLAASVIAPDGTETPLVSTNNASMIQGSVGNRPPGIYRLVVRGKVGSTKLDPAELPFQMIQRSAELDRPEADLALMRQIAAMTSSHGGRDYGPDEMDALADRIRQDRRQSVTPIVDRYRLGEGPISGLTVYALFAIALSAEWYLRRRWNLV